MRKFFILFGIPFLFLFSFTTNEDLKFDLISPMGFKLAKSQTELIKLLDNDDIKFITNIKYIENERFNAAIVDVELANHSILTYIV